MRPILQSAVLGNTPYRFPPIVLDVNLDPGNVNWAVFNKGTGATLNSPSLSVQVWATNDDPFAPTFDPLTANWFWVHNAFSLPPASGAAQFADEVSLSNNSPGALTNASGAIAYAPRALQFRIVACANGPTVLVEVVQGSGGRS